VPSSSMPPLHLSAQQARRFLLAHQCLWPPHSLVGKPGVLAYIRRVRCIQFDPLDIVGRNPDLVLQARVGDYCPAMLRELLYQERQLLDGWDKNMSIYPVEDWPYFRRRREAARQHAGKSHAQVEAIAPQVRRELEERGPLSSLELDFGQTVDWFWAPTRLARAALESMYFWGELVIHHRVHTRKVYDLAHRHIPAELLAAPEPNETPEAFHDWYMLRRLGSIGLLWNRSGSAWLGMSDIKSGQRAAALHRLMAQGLVREARIEGSETPFYLRSADAPLLDTVAEDTPPHAAILAPLDNLLWDRELARALFGFDYVWEVYKPVAERRYGYYVLPVLYGDRFVARFAPERDKRNGTLTIKGWWWEPGVSVGREMQAALRDCFRRFLDYLGAEELRLTDDAAGLEWLCP
jgi:uncharacterized protein YcaQ